MNALLPLGIDIDAFNARANALHRDCYEAFIELCNSISFDGHEADEADPFSPAIRDAVLQRDLYVAGIAKYQPYDQELAHFTDTHAPLDRQLPFLTRDPQTIGRSTKPGSMSKQATIHDAAPGRHSNMGNHGPTNHRAAVEQASVKAYREEFGYRPNGERPVDALIFFEAFHRSLDLIELARTLHEMLRPRGRLLLGGETIYPWFPVSWGLRQDGCAVWAIRSFKLRASDLEPERRSSRPATAYCPWPTG